jgi:hypothetical protein
MSFELEALFTSPAAFALSTPSPLQRALCRAADGRPLDNVLDDEACHLHFGCNAEELGKVLPALVVLIAGVRGGKSLIASAAAVKAALSADLSALLSHEIARVAIIAPTVDNASATFRLLAGSIESAPLLRRLVDGEIGSDSLTLRRADGRLVEIVVVAAHRGAVTVRSRWLAGFVLDEVALFGVESTGAAVNAEEILRAAETRLVRGAQGWLVSSPYGPAGLLHDLWRLHFGKPGSVLVVHAPTRALNPAFCVEKIEEVRRRDPDAAAREYDAAWLDPDTAFFDGSTIDAATRESPLEEPPLEGVAYAAAWDAATRGNSWTLAIARRTDEGTERTVIAGAWQWTGSRQAPLDPGVVIDEIAAILRRYGVSDVYCDGWSADALRPIARGAGFQLRERTRTTDERTALFTQAKTLLATASLALPPHAILVADLKAVRKRVLGNGIRVDLPRTTNGRHCDFAPSVVLVIEAAAAARTRADAGPIPELAIYRSPLDDGGFAGSMRSLFDDGTAIAADLTTVVNNLARTGR